MSSGKFSCDICAHFYQAWTETGVENMRMRCEMEDEAGVAVLNSVKVESDCPFASRIVMGAEDDVYPKRELRKEPDKEPFLHTYAEYNPNINPYRRIKKPTKREIDRY